MTDEKDTKSLDTLETDAKHKTSKLSLALVALTGVFIISGSIASYSNAKYTAYHNGLDKQDTIYESYEKAFKNNQIAVSKLDSNFSNTTSEKTINKLIDKYVRPGYTQNMTKDKLNKVYAPVNTNVETLTKLATTQDKLLTQTQKNLNKTYNEQKESQKRLYAATDGYAEGTQSAQDKENKIEADFRNLTPDALVSNALPEGIMVTKEPSVPYFFDDGTQKDELAKLQDLTMEVN